MLRTLFINPNKPHPLGELSAIEPPLWLGLMADDYLEDGNEVSIIDAEAENLSITATVAAALEWNPDNIVIVVMGNNPSVSSTPKMGVAKELLTTLKPHKKTYLTGLHPMALPDENTLVWKPKKCLPLPWHLLPMDKYRAHNWHCLDGSARQPYTSTYTSLGCSFSCYYCNIHTLYNDRKLMLRDTSSIFHEVYRLVRDYDIRNLKIWDELFAVNEKRVLEVCKILSLFVLNCWAYARVDTVTEKMLHAMKEAGINWVAYGFENASPEVRESSNKHFKESQVERAIKMTRDAGINIIANFTFGLPGEDEDSADRTLAFAKRHLFEWCNFYVALPYPGSQWYEDTKPNWGYKAYDQYETHHFWTPIRDKAFNEYFRDPDYQNMIEKRFGSQGLRQIQGMLAVRGRV